MSPPPLLKCSVPPLTDQPPAVRAFFVFQLIHPASDLPSKSSFQPAFFSASLSVLSAGGRARSSLLMLTGAPFGGTSTLADHRMALTIIRRNASIWKLLYGCPS